jgi:hypothetical protein
MSGRTSAWLRRAFILVHRWMGIAGGLLFIAWFVSGMVFAFREMPRFTSEERLSHLLPLDLSAATVEPLEAAQRLGIRPARLRVGMYYDGRPVYRFQDNASAYADTGEKVPGRDRDEAVAFVRQLLPEHAATVRYDRLMEGPDLWTAGGGREQGELHKIAVGDAADTYYYISERTGEPVMKTDRSSRFWGFWGPVLHQFYFTPLRSRGALWDQIILWCAVLGALMCVSGLIAGMWAFSPSARYRQKSGPSFSAYSGWMKWHHYAGLLFGLVSLTWIFSGGLAFNSYGFGSSTNPTARQRDAATGGPLDLSNVTLDSLRRSIEAIAPEFVPKEADVQQFRGDLYVVAANGPTERHLIGITERAREQRPVEFRMVWLAHPENGAFTKFDDAVMMDIARDAMRGTTIRDTTWLQHYDNYYRTRLAALPLPVLRVRYNDPQETWLYIDPFRGSVAWREEWSSRTRRWLYNGLHKLDVPVLYENRPLWDIAIVALSIGGLVLSVTTLVPAYRRLRRHAVRLALRARGDGSSGRVKAA